MSELHDGWDDDELSSLEEDDDVEDDDESGDEEEEGDDDDDDDDDDEIEGVGVDEVVCRPQQRSMRPKQTAMTPPSPPSSPLPPLTSLSWPTGGEVPYVPPLPPPPPPPPLPPMYYELRRYLDMLPHMASSINAVLEAEHNSNSIKAWDLVRYYEERPGLVEYTLEKELPRMHYTWLSRMVNDDDHHHTHNNGEPIINDKVAIARLLHNEAQINSILPRCANQSLLADLLEYLSCSKPATQQQQHYQQHQEDDGLIRRRFHMACQTEHVEFVLNPEESTVLVKAILHLCLPHPSKGMVPVARVHVSCQFAPTIPLWRYHLESIVPLLLLPNKDAAARKPPQPQSAPMTATTSSWDCVGNNRKEEDEPADPLLLEVAYFLQELVAMDEQEGEFGTTTEGSGGGEAKHFRDAFLHQAAIGVWNQIQQAGRVSSETLARHLSLPSDDLLERARQAEETAQAASLQQRQEYHQRQQHHPMSQVYPDRHVVPPPPPPPPPPPAERPKSILGGMISRIAQSVVALPHEDSSMYDEWRRPQTEQASLMPEWPGRPRQQQQVSHPSAAAEVMSSTQSLLHPPVVAPPQQQLPSGKPSPTIDPPTNLVSSTRPVDPSFIRNPNHEPRHPPLTTAVPSKGSAFLGRTVSDVAETSVAGDGDPCGNAADDDDNDGWANDDDDLLLLDDDDNDNNNEKDGNLLPNNGNDGGRVDNVHGDPLKEGGGAAAAQEQPVAETGEHLRFVQSIAAKKNDQYNTTVTHSPSLSDPPMATGANSLGHHHHKTTINDTDDTKGAADEPTPTTNDPHDDNNKDEEEKDWVYDPISDIVPTRTRWINPRPGPRQLSQLRLVHHQP